MRFSSGLFVVVALLLMPVTGCAASLPAAAADPVIAITGADVLPMTATAQLRDQTVLVAGDRIRAVGPRRSTAIPKGARIIDARGMTLMPGLVDMHVHLPPEPGQPGDAAQRALALMLAHGVTAARGMAGSVANLAVRNAVEEGKIAGPRFYAAAPGMRLQNTPDAAAARDSVAAAKETGYDLIKSHHIIDVAVWEAIQDEAARQGLPTAGHVTNQVGLPRALAAGQEVEHLDGILLELLDEDAPERKLEFAQIPPPPVVLAAARASDAEIAAVARRIAAARGYQVPTLALFETVSQVDRSVEELVAAPEMRYMPEAVLRQWAAQRAQFPARAGYTPTVGAAFRDLRRRIVRALHEAGVPIMAGSDTAQAFHIWGHGLIREIEALAAAGLSPTDALRSATVVPRDYFRSLPKAGSSLGWAADFGTVEPGARADLILLAADPRSDLKTLYRPRLVIAGGRAHDRASLDEMLSEAARAAKRDPGPSERLR